MNEHTDVGAYALGVLDPQDVERFEAHLTGCGECARHLAELAPLPGLLIQVPPPMEPPPAMLDRLMADTRTVRRRQKMRRWALAACATLLIAAGPAVTAMVTAEDGGQTTPVAAASAKVMFDREGERKAVKDPNTGVDATVAMWPRKWGTEIALKLSSVDGPESCDLVAVSSDGTRQTVTTWSVPEGGYGKNPLYTIGGTGIDRADIDRFEIRTLDGQHLVTLPGQ